MNKWIKRALIVGAAVAATIAILVVALGAWIATCTDCLQFG